MLLLEHTMQERVKLLKLSCNNYACKKWWSSKLPQTSAINAVTNDWLVVSQC